MFDPSATPPAMMAPLSGGIPNALEMMRARAPSMPGWLFAPGVPPPVPGVQYPRLPWRDLLPQGPALQQPVVQNFQPGTPPTNMLDARRTMTLGEWMQQQQQRSQQLALDTSGGGMGGGRVPGPVVYGIKGVNQDERPLTAQPYRDEFLDSMSLGRAIRSIDRLQTVQPGVYSMFGRQL